MKTQPYHIVRNSKIHGRGVFARRPIRKGTRIIEYTGPIITAKQAEKVGSEIVDGHGHTMLFQLDDKRVINGNEGGDARYINHGCDPNCEAEQDGDHIFITAIKSIKQGEELVYDYHLQVEGKITDKVRKEYACFCGSPKCRGSQIAANILEKQAKKDEKKRLKKEKKQLKAKAKAEAKLKDKAKTKADSKESKKKKKDTKKGKPETTQAKKVKPDTKDKKGKTAKPDKKGKGKRKK
jgi:hypothetical protein